MTCSLLHVSWRVLLALSLVAGSWPSAAWVALAPDPAAATTNLADCHGGEVETATPESNDAPCDNGCCPDRACDPAHCVLLLASIATPAFRVSDVPLAAAPDAGNERLATGPPLLILLRPPIA